MLQLSDEEILPIIENNNHLHKLCLQHLNAEKHKASAASQQPESDLLSPKQETMMSLLDRQKEHAWAAAEQSRRQQRDEREEQYRLQQQFEVEQQELAVRQEHAAQLRDQREWGFNTDTGKAECRDGFGTIVQVQAGDDTNLLTEIDDFKECISELRKMYEARIGEECKLSDAELVPVLIRDPQALKFMRIHLASPK